MTKVLYQLKNLPAVQEDDLETFKSFFNQVYGLFHATQTVQGELYLKNPQLTLQLAAKLPSYNRHEWSRYKANLTKQGVDVDMEHFLRWLENELDIAFASFNPVQAKTKSKSTDKKQLFTHLQSQTKTYSTSICLHCKSKDHSRIWQCDKFKRLAIDDRRATAKRLRICFLCLEIGHGSKTCKKEITCKTCGARHNILLHKDRDESNPLSTLVTLQQNETSEEDSENEETSMTPPTTNLSILMDTAASAEQDEATDNCSYESENESLYAHFRKKNVLLRVAKIKVFGPGEKGIVVYALFDEASQSTIMDSKLADELKLLGDIHPVTYQWTGGITKHYPNSMNIKSMEICRPESTSKRHKLRFVRTIENLDLPPQRFDLDKILQLYPMANGKLLKEIRNFTPRMLIGSDHAELITPRKSFSYKDDGLQYCKCQLGWTIHGPIESSNEEPKATLGIHLTSKTDEALDKILAEQYRIENFGITNHPSLLSKDDQRALDIMKKTVKKIGNRYEIGLPYRFENMKFPESKQMALKRLSTIERKMDADQNYAEKYCAKIEDYVTKGYAKKLELEENVDSDKSWYLPHFGVVNVNKPGKFRLVMDAKAQSHGIALNDLLLKGPDFVPALVHVLWRARLQKIGFVADIMEMFHQIHIRPEDRASQRFLWRGMRRTGEPDIYEMNAMIFGAVSSPSQAQFVKNHNAKSLVNINQNVIDAICMQHYVDDYVHCSKTVEEAIQLIKDVTQTQENGGFKLAKFISNSPEVMKSIPEEYRGVPREDGLERVLGVLWDLKSDEYIVSFEIPALMEWKTINRAPTKREILKAMMSVFDPLGICQPFMIKLKILFQELWRKKLDWNDFISNEYCKKWQNWLEEAASLKEIRIRRCYFPEVPSVSAAELHTFCDASDKGYAAVTYLRINHNEKHYVAFVQAKSKVAPIKHLTIPRMELQACVMGHEIAQAVVKEIGIPIVKKVFWTDSKIVKSWFTTSQKLNAFVGARVTKIFEHEDTNVDDWRWIPSALNVADLGTKDQACYMQQWINGPEFLTHEECDWKFTMPELTEEELKCLYTEVIDQVFLGNINNSCACLPDLNRFSKFNRLVRATAYSMKMVKALRLTKAERPTRGELYKLSMEDLQKARIEWYREVQKEFFSEEISDLETKGFVKRSSVLFTHAPFIQDGILRLRSRVQDPLCSFEENNPVILHAKHRFTYLLMVYYHERNLHGGVRTVINNLRQTFDIIGVTTAVKRIFRNCVSCKIQRSTPHPPHMAQLPDDRVVPRNRAFEVVGLDYAGPFEVTVGRRHEKRWIALFNDIPSRAVHVEIVHKLTTDSAIKAIKRFANKRGVPVKIISDNATCFRGADKELQNFFQNMKISDGELADELSIRNIDWSFIPPGSPHFGGVYERKVGSIKCGLKVALTEVYPDDETFETAISDVVNVINNTPITELSSDPTEQRAVTPNDLVLGKLNGTNIDIPQTELNQVKPYTWMAAQLIANRFWQKWVKEYRTIIQRPTKWFSDRNAIQLNIGDIVLIADENLKRNEWPKGRITEIHPGKDGKVRAVTVKTQKGFLKRASAKIVRIQQSEQQQAPWLENVELKEKKN